METSAVRTIIPTYRKNDDIVTSSRQRQWYVAALKRAIDLEERGDEQKKKGRYNCAARRYRRAIDIESMVLGKDHHHTAQLTKKLFSDSVDLRVGSVALKDSFTHEEVGDRQRKEGFTANAVEEYTISLTIEGEIVGTRYDGKESRMISLLKKKQSLAAASEGNVDQEEEEREGEESKTCICIFPPKGLRQFSTFYEKKCVVPRAA